MTSSRAAVLVLGLAALGCARAPTCPLNNCAIVDEGATQPRAEYGPVSTEELCLHYVELQRLDQGSLSQDLAPDLHARCLDGLAQASDRLTKYAYEKLTWCASRAHALASFENCLDANWGGDPLINSSVSPRNAQLVERREQPRAAQASEPRPTYDHANLTEDEKATLAKDHYLEAERLAAEGDWLAATKFYEEAYYLVPGKHGFAYKVGVAAFQAGHCGKAVEYMRHFLMYGDESKHAEQFEQAKLILAEISISGCDSR